jgi:hypothetical protein
LSVRQNEPNSPSTPITQRLPAITRNRFGLFRFRSPLLTESRLLSLPVGNEMFHFPTFPPHALCVQAWVTGHDSCRVSPFGNPRITARLTAPRGLSQPPTSFIGSWCQGIHRVPLITWSQKMLASTVQFSSDGRSRLRARRREGHHRLSSQCPPVRRWSGPGHVTTPSRGRWWRSGPRMRKARTLRTQQRAWVTLPAESVVPGPGGLVLNRTP